MCGRISQYRSWQDMLEYYRLIGTPQNLAPRYNVAPTASVGTIRLAGDGREHVPMRWWLVPSWWKKSLGDVPSTFNAKCEGIADKPMFRSAFRHRRCIVWADGFYEWRREGKERIPFYITRADAAPLSLAGLWERWTNPEDGGTIESCTVITCPPNEMMAGIHNRMPVVLDPARLDDWLSGGAGEELLVACPNDVLSGREVSSFVNNSRNDGPQCIEPASHGCSTKV